MFVYMNADRQWQSPELYIGIIVFSSLFLYCLVFVNFLKKKTLSEKEKKTVTTKIHQTFTSHHKKYNTSEPSIVKPIEI